MARITLPGFSRGIYAVGPLVFEDGVCELEGDLPPVVQRLAFALGASIDGEEPPAEDPGPGETPEGAGDPTPAELWGVQGKVDGTDEAADPAAFEAPEIDYSAPTGVRTAPEPAPAADSGDSDVTPGSEATDEVPAPDAPTSGSDVAPSEPQPTELDGTPIPAPADPTPEEQAAADASTSTPADESTSGKHAADEPVDAEPAPEPVPAVSASPEDVAAAQATESTVVDSSTDGSTTVDAPASGA